ncbi:MAG: hypothetical protein ACRCU0_02840 [Candidatus Rhabdochlamydia sp.]
MTGVNLNITESINSFIKPLGVRLSSKEQILAKVTMVAIAAILIADNLPSASAYDCTWFNNCIGNCPTGPLTECVKACFRSCCAIPDCRNECVTTCSIVRRRY